MDQLEAKILLKNLLKRIRHIDEDCYELSGNLTDDEMVALKHALSALEGSTLSYPTATQTPTTNDLAPPQKPVSSLSFTPDTQTGLQPLPGSELAHAESLVATIEIDLSVLELPSPPPDHRLCLDFGTAMSKVTLVHDSTPKRSYEDIEVLHLGVPGDQEEVSLTMLVSSVFIDNAGSLWFGQMAVKRAKLEPGRKRLDNIKHYLSVEGDGLNSRVTEHFNPTDIEITYGDMLLAYLMFLTWTVNCCLKDSEEPRNLNRRFAMPCFTGRKFKDMEQLLGGMLGEAQILSDTFFKTLQDGVPLSKFVEAVRLLRKTRRNYPFVGAAIAEPLGVAGSIMSWEQNVNSLIMIIDVGAGTSDFSLYRLKFDETEGKSIALEVEESSEGITEAGNHLDTLLRGLILQKACINSQNKHWINIIGNLELDLRDYKERLFLDGEISVRLFNDEIVNVSLNEFLSLSQVQKFGDSLKECRDRILNRIDQSFIQSAPHGALGIALTGGGASLPMVKALATGSVKVKNKELKLNQTQEFPRWLQKEFPELESDYPRIAVSLGGARNKVIDRGGVASVTAGDVRSTPILGGYYTKGR